MPATHEIERHPLRPFLPDNAKLLMLGSFPPPKERWCMEFFYPNPQNDMWRIMGHIFFGDKTHFEGQRNFLKVQRDNVQRQVRRFSTATKLSLSAKQKALPSSTRRKPSFACKATRRMNIWKSSNRPTSLSCYKKYHSVMTSAAQAAKPHKRWQRLFIAFYQKSANSSKQTLPTELFVSGECRPPHALTRYPLTRKPLRTGGCLKLSVCYENLYYHIYLTSWTYRHRK